MNLDILYKQLNRIIMEQELSTKDRQQLTTRLSCPTRGIGWKGEIHVGGIGNKNEEQELKSQKAN
jgi:hypothetical protein